MSDVAFYQTKMAHHHDWSSLHFPVWESVREFVRKCLLSLRNADIAMKEGKTMQLLRERLVGPGGIKDLQVDQSRKEGDDGLVHMYLVSSGPLSEQEKAILYTTVDDVNARYGTHIYVFMNSPRSSEGGGYGPKQR